MDAFSNPPALDARDNDTAELRHDCPRWVLNTLDAVSMARGEKSRAALVNEILEGWAQKKRHEAMLVHRVAGGNPTDAEPRGGSR